MKFVFLYFFPDRYNLICGSGLKTNKNLHPPRLISSHLDLEFISQGIGLTVKQNNSGSHHGEKIGKCLPPRLSLPFKNRPISYGRIVKMRKLVLWGAIIFSFIGLGCGRM